MRIWLVNHYAVPPTQPGITRHYTLARELINRGHEVTVIASSFDHVTRTESKLAPGETRKYEEVLGVPFLWLKTPEYSGNSVARIKNMLSFAKSVAGLTCAELGDRPDYIIGSSPHLFAAYAAKLLADRVGSSFVLEVRDLWPQSLIDLANVSAFNPLVLILRQIERYLYKNAVQILTPLPNAAPHLIANGAHPDRILWLPNGILSESVPFPSAPEVKDTPFTVMYAGAHGFANGLDTVLEAAAILKQEGLGAQYKITLVGDGPEKNRLQQLAKERCLDNLQFEEPVPKDQIYRKMQEADAFMMNLKDSPVFKWGVSPNKLFDYLACGKPVIYGVRSPYNPVSEVDAGITVPPSDPGALAEAVKALAGMSVEARFEMGLRGRKVVEEQYDWSKQSAELERVLLRLMGIEKSSQEEASPELVLSQVDS